MFKKITYKNILSILFSGVLFGCIKYIFEKEFNTSLNVAVLMFGVIFEILVFFAGIYFTPERTNRWENKIKKMLQNFKKI